MIAKQCNEMLGSANVLDAAGRQMILNFMSGNKSNSNFLVSKSSLKPQTILDQNLEISLH